MGQGSLGDCSFAAAAISLAGVNPTAIRNMIQDHEDGTFTVTFPGRSPVTLTYDRNAPGANTRDGIWLRVLEQAAARTLGNPTLSLFPREAIELLTGGPVNHRTWNFSSRDNWQGHIEESLSNGKPVAVSVGGGEAAGKKGYYNGIVTDHAYIIVGNNTATQKYTLQNPWGRNGEWGQKYDWETKTWEYKPEYQDGRFEMTMKEIYDTFRRLDYQE